MSGTYPTSPVFNSVNFTSEFFNLSSQTISGRTQVRNIGGQRFTFTASYPAMTRAEFSPVQGFLMAQRGMAETFTIVLPEVSSSSGSVVGTILAGAAASIGDTSIALDGFTGTLKAGDVFKFANHNKVYMATADLAGAGTLSFQPALVASVSDNEILTHDDVPFTVRLNNDVQEYGISTDLTYSYEVDFIEAI
tara:strand:- start:1261 stop:1839 length:579 start_codon:yes stop_codon:yes gene_type:complete